MPAGFFCLEIENRVSETHHVFKTISIRYLHKENINNQL